MLSKEPVVRSAPKASTASKINELVHNFRSKNLKKIPAGKRTCLLPCRSWMINSVLSFEQN